MRHFATVLKEALTSVLSFSSAHPPMPEFPSSQRGRFLIFRVCPELSVLITVSFWCSRPEHCFHSWNQADTTGTIENCFRTVTCRFFLGYPSVFNVAIIVRPLRASGFTGNQSNWCERSASAGYRNYFSFSRFFWRRCWARIVARFCFSGQGDEVPPGRRGEEQLAVLCTRSRLHAQLGG